MPTQTKLRFLVLFIFAAAPIGACASRYLYDKKSPDELYADAGIDITNGDGGGAIAKLEYLKEKYPAFPDREGMDFRFAEAKKTQGKLWKAFVDFRDFLEKYPITTRYSATEAALFEIGSKLIESDASFLGLGIARDADDGVLVLEYLVQHFPASAFGDEALRRMAQYKFDSGDNPGAIRDYERILKGHLASQWRDLAEYRIAIAHLRSVRRPDLDQSELLKAKESLVNYLATRPEGARLDEARAALAETQEKLAESEFRIGEFYRVIDHPFGAALHYKTALLQYPGTQYSARAEERLRAMPDNIPPPEGKRSAPYQAGN